jgi:RNA polymerase sigma-70 factor (ECF subfamily)
LHPSGDALDDRLALLFVACDEAIAPSSQMVLALRVVCGLTTAQIATHLGIQTPAAAARLTRAKRALADARGSFNVPGEGARADRLPMVLACVAGMFTVAHRTVLDPVDALADSGRQSLSIADALAGAYPDDPEVRGLRAVIRLGLARRPGRLDATGTALTLDEVDRSRWDTGLLAGGLDDATLAARSGSGRFAIEAAISGLHSTAASAAATDWHRIVDLYRALEQVWPAPSVTVARLAAEGQFIMQRHGPDTAAVELSAIEGELLRLEASSAAYVSRDANLTLADLAWRTGRGEEAAARYRELADVMPAEPLRRFCLRRAQR